MNKIRTTFLCLLICCGLTLLTAHPKFWGGNNLPVYQNSDSRADSLHGFDVTKYEISLTINDQTHFINGVVQANVTIGQQYSGIDYNLVGLNVSEVKVNDTVTAYTHINGIVHINFPATTGQQIVTKVTYSGTPQLSPDTYRNGMIFGTNSVFTITDPDAGRYWWPSYDHPWDKAIVDLHITLRSDWLVACNGLRSNIVDNGNGTKTHNWLGSNPMATYLVCLTAGPYVEINQTAGTVPIQNFVTQSQYNNAVTDFSTLPAILQYYETQFGTYPFEKYGNAVVNMSTFSAMEHQTMTTLAQQNITGTHSGELTIAHELAHQWYGDCLTPLTYKDVWLSEGFATYSEFLWMHKRDGWQAACNYVNSSFHQYYLSWESISNPHIIYNPDFNNYFAPPSYEKSASVLHMLRLKIGNANFFQLLQNWFTTYHNSNVVTSEFQAMAEQISGQDLGDFFNQWIYQAGIPSVEYTVFSSADLGRVKIIAKTSSLTATRFHLDIPVALAASPADSVVIQACPDGYINDLAFNTNADLSTLSWDPKHWVLARQHSVNQLQLVQCLGSNNAVVLTWSALTCPLAITGYNVWRKLSGESIWNLVNQNPINALSYIDSTAITGTEYQYRITAIEEGGYESVPSNILSATPMSFPFDRGLLVVDETRDGSGTATSPNDIMVDNFYQYILNPINYTSWDYASQNTPDLNTLSHYPIILWHADDYNQNLIATNLSNLSSYLLGGGKLILSGWKTPGVFTPEFINLFMPDITFNFNNSNVLLSALSDNYPTLVPDSDKIFTTWNGQLGMVYTFANAQNVLYTAEMTPNALGNGEPIVVRFDHNGSLIVFGFPMYCLQNVGARAFIQQILQEMDLPVANDDNTLEVNKLSLTCSPNPFRDNLNIVFNQKLNPHGSLKIYNIKGQLVSAPDISTNKSGDNSIRWTPKDNNGKPLPTGIYLLQYQDSKSCLTKKLIYLN